MSSSTEMVCPLLREDCRGLDCAWFVEARDRCALTVLAGDVGGLTGRLDGLSHALVLTTMNPD